MRNHKGAKLKVSSFELLISIVKGFSRLLSRLPSSTRLSCWPDNNTKRRVMTARLRLLSCLTSASVDTSQSPEQHGTASAGPAPGRNGYKFVPLQPIQAHWCYKLDGFSLGAPGEAPKNSSSNLARPTTNFVPELHGTSRFVSSEQTAGFSKESDFTTQQPLDAIFHLHV